MNPFLILSWYNLALVGKHKGKDHFTSPKYFANVATHTVGQVANMPDKLLLTDCRSQLRPAATSNSL